MKRGYHFDVYSGPGLCSMSVCTDMENTEDIEAEANSQYPTGIGSRWRISEDKTFKGGGPMPGRCEKGGGRRHWLLHC